MIERIGNEEGIEFGGRPQETETILVAQADTAGAGQPGSDAQVAAVETRMLVEVEQGSILRLPADASIDQPRVNGADLEFVQADGSVIVVPNGAIQGLTIFIGDVEIPPQTVAALFEANNIETAAGPAGAGARSSGGNFEVPVGGIGDAFDIGDLLPPTELAFTGPEFRDLYPANTRPGFGSSLFSLALSEEGLTFGLADSNPVGSDTTDLPYFLIDLGASDPDGDPLTFTLGLPNLAITSNGVPVVWDGVGTDHLIGRAGGLTVLDITVGGPTGVVFIRLMQPVDHPLQGEDVLTLGLTVTADDGRGGTATTTLNIGIEDDSPLVGQPDAVFTDEDGLALGVGDTTSPGDNDDGNRHSAVGSLGIQWGADRGDVTDGVNGDDSFAQDGVGRSVYFSDDDFAAFKLSAAGLTSGKQALEYELLANGTIIAARLPANGNVPGDLVFQVSLSDDDAGWYKFQLFGKLDHPLTSNGNTGEGIEDDIVLAIDFTASDADGDLASGTFSVTIDDDMPVIEVNPVANASVVHDESAWPQNPIWNFFGPSGDRDDDDVGVIASVLRVSQLFGGVADKGNDPDVPGAAKIFFHGAIGYAQSTQSLVSVNVDFGADGAATSDSQVFSLQLVPGAASGLFTTDGKPIVLADEGGIIVGRADGLAAIAITIDPETGKVSIAQWLSLKHDTNSHDEVVALNPNTVLVKVTATDGDGDARSATADVSQQIRFEDDGPRITEFKLASRVSITHDETFGVDGDADDVGVNHSVLFASVADKGNDRHVQSGALEPAIGYAQVSGGDFFDYGADFGSDGPRNGGYDFAFKIGQSATSLHTTGGQAITLHLEGDLIVGRYGGAGNDKGRAAFALHIDPADGTITMVQYVSLRHPDGGSSHDEAISLVRGNVQVVLTVTDGDGDTASRTIDIGHRIGFEDDGPSVDVSGAGSPQRPAALDAMTLDESIGRDSGDSNARADDVSGVNAPSFLTVPNAAKAIGVVSSPTGNRSVANLFDVDVEGGADGVKTIDRAYGLVLRDGSGNVVSGAGIGVKTSLVVTDLVGLNGMSEADRTIYLFQQADGSVIGRIGQDSASSADDFIALRMTLSGNPPRFVIEHYLPVQHPDTGTSHDEAVKLVFADSAASLGIQLTVTVTDGDNDIATDSHTVLVIDGKTDSIVSIEDDGPKIADLKLGRNVTLVHDETLGRDPDSDDVSGPLSVFSGVTNPGDDPDVGGNLPIGFARQAGFVEYAVDFGTDGAARADSVVFAFNLKGIGANGLDSGLETTEGRSIRLHLENGIIVGRVVGGSFHGDAAFAIAIDPANGDISMVQYLSLHHPRTSSDDEAVGFDLDRGKAIEIVLTVKDGDGDTATRSIDITSRIKFEDDGPSITRFALEDGKGLVHDETPGQQTALADDLSGGRADLFTRVRNKGNDPDVDSGGLEPAIGYAQVSGSTLFNSSVDFGVDGPGKSAFAFALDIDRHSTDLQTTDGKDIRLFQLDNGVIVGRYDENNGNITSSDPAAFALHIDPVTGNLTLVQYVSLRHKDSDSADEVAYLSARNVRVTLTVTDGDGDTDSRTISIGDRIGFRDDGPSTNAATVTGSLDDDSQSKGNPGGVDDDADGKVLNGNLNFNAGADGLKSIAFDGAETASFQAIWIDGNGVGHKKDVKLVWEPDANGAGILKGTMVDGNNVTQPVLTLTVGADGHFTLEIHAPLAHQEPGAEPNHENDLLLDLGYTITDGDDDTARGTLSVEVDDDTPVLVGDGIDDGSVTALGAAITGDLNIAFGADGMHAQSGLQITGWPDIPGTTAKLSDDGLKLEVFVGGEDSTTRFYTLTLDPTTGQYNFVQHSALAAGAVMPTVQVSGGGKSVESIDFGSFSIHGGNGEIFRSGQGLGIDDGNMDNGDTFELRFDDPMDKVALGLNFSGSGTLKLQWTTDTGETGTTDPFSNGPVPVDPANPFTRISFTVVVDSAPSPNAPKFKLSSVGGESAGAVKVTDLAFIVNGRDGDGDSVSDNFLITLRANSVPTITLPEAGSASTQVDEAGLPARGNGPAGSEHSANTETASGTIGFTALDGIQSVTLGGNALSMVDQTFDDGTRGTLTARYSFDPATGQGQIHYTYTLIDNTSGDSTAATFAVEVEDIDGETAPAASLVIDIIDDVPTARPDTGAVTEGDTLNVVEADGLLKNDIAGADGVTIAGIRAAGGDTTTAVTNGVLTVSTALGTLTVQANGAYTYAANPNKITAAAQDVFVYTLRDGDGDLSTTTLTINLSDVTLVADNQTKSVDEAALDLVDDGDDLAAGTVTGSAPSSTAETVTGTLNVAGTGVVYTLTGPATGIYGQIQINSDGSYIYTLTRQVDGTTADNGANTVNGAESFDYTATDANGNSVSGTIKIDIKDDIPTASNETAQDVNEGATASGSFDFVPGADGATLTHIGNTLVVFDQPENWSAWMDVGAGEIRVKANGAYEFKADAATLGSVPVTGTFTVTDGDGDVSTATFAFTVKDANAPTGGTATARVDDDGLAGANHPTVDASLASFSGTLGGNVGGDGAGANGFSFAALDGQTITVGSESATLSWANDVLTATGPRGVLFTVTVTDPASGAYTVSLKDNVLHTGGNNGETDNSVGLGYVITDADGSMANGTLTINFNDDMPTAVDDAALSVVEGGAQIGGNVLTHDAQGADGATVTHVKLPGAAGFVAISGSPFATAYGTYTFATDGAWTFTPANGLNNAAGIDASFSYRITDGDGDISEAVQPITVTDGAGPTAGEPITLALDDENLSNGTNPSGPDDASGSIAFTPGSDAIASIAFSNDLTDLDDSLVWQWVSDTQIVGKNASGDPIVQLDLTRSGDSANVKATLLASYADHEGIDQDDLQDLGSVKVVATDIDGDFVEGTVNVTVSDDMPFSDGAEATATAGVKPTVNAIFVVDLSLSMGTASADPLPSDNTINTRLKLLQVAVTNLLNNPDVDFQDITIFTFGTSGATAFRLQTDNVQAALAEINSYTQSSLSGGTDYNAAVQAVMQYFTLARINDLPEAMQTNLYFLTDGDPQSGGNVANTAAWRSFLTNTLEVDHVYSVGFSGLTSASFLNQIVRPDKGDIAQFVTDPGLLSSTLQGSLPGNPSGNILEHGDGFGADGGHIASFTYDGITFQFDGDQTITHTGTLPANWLINANGKQVTIIDDLGGKLIFNFAQNGLNAEGDWDYYAPNNNHGELNFGYVLVDNDGDTASGTLTIDVQLPPNTAPSANNDAISVVEATSTNGGTASSTVNVLSNDTDPGDVLKVTEVTGPGGSPIAVADGASVVVQGFYGTLTIHSNGTTTYKLINELANTQALKGSQNVIEVFNYQVTDSGGLTANAQINVNIAGRNDAPVIWAPSAHNYIGSSGTSYPIHVLKFSDVDSTGSVTVTLSTNDNDARFFASSQGGVTVSGNNSTSLTLSGTIANINAFIADKRLSYRMDDNSDTITVTINDADGGTSTQTFSIGIVSPNYNGNSTNNLNANNVFTVGVGTQNAGNSTDVVTTSFYHSVSVTYSGGSGTDTIRTLFTADQLNEVLNYNLSAVRNFFDGSPGSGMNLSSTGWNASVSGDWESAQLGIAAPRHLGGSGTADDNYISLDTWIGTGSAIGNPANQIATNASAGQTFTGNASNNLIVGGAANQTLNGGNGNDVLVAFHGGKNTLDGGAGADFLVGGDGDDILIGGTGNDVLAGGKGADTFVFNEAGVSNQDLIADYDFMEGDAIDLTGLLAANFGTGDDINNFVRLTQSGNDVTISVDTNGTQSGIGFENVATLAGYGASGHDPVKIIIDDQEYTLTI